MKKILIILAYILILSIPVFIYLYTKYTHTDEDISMVKSVSICAFNDWKEGVCDLEDGIILQEIDDIVLVMKLNRSKTDNLEVNMMYDDKEIMRKRYDYWDIGDNSELAIIFERDIKNNWLLGEYNVKIDAVGKTEEIHDLSFVISN
mgnify:CR=1 FL=1